MTFVNKLKYKKVTWGQHRGTERCTNGMEWVHLSPHSASQSCETSFHECCTALTICKFIGLFLSTINGRYFPLLRSNTERSNINRAKFRKKTLRFSFEIFFSNRRAIQKFSWRHVGRKETCWNACTCTYGGNHKSCIRIH